MTMQVIPETRIVICDCCKRKVGDPGVHRSMSGGMMVRRDALDFQGSACANADISLDLCDECLRHLVDAVNKACDDKRAALAAQPVNKTPADWYARREAHAREMGYAGLAEALQDLEERRAAQPGAEDGPPNPPITRLPVHGDDAGDGLRYVMCQFGAGEHYRDFILIPHADGQYVTAAKLQPFGAAIMRAQLAKWDGHTAAHAQGGGDGR